VELNNRYTLPSERAARLAKELGCKFTYGSNNKSASDLGRCEHGLDITEKLKLKWTDLWVPGAFGAKAIERKGAMLRG
jgi:histidinol phosphatase-like PHP family hydrolase